MIFFTLLGVGLMVWIYRGFDFTPLVHVFSVRDNYLWIVLTLLMGVAANVFRSLRWRMLLMGAGIPIRRRRAIELVFISYFINSITPRLGELTRSLLVKRGDVDASAKAFGTVIVEKLADVVCLMLVVIVAIVMRWDDTALLMRGMFDSVEASFSSAVIYAVVGIALCIAFLFNWYKVKQLRVLIHSLWLGISAVVSLESPWLFVGLCLSIWICNFLQLYLLIPCFVQLQALNWIDAFFLFSAASVGVLLPTPGGAGPWHFAIVKTLTNVFGTEVSLAKLFALVTHGLKTMLVIILGLLAYITFYWEVWGKSNKKK